MRRVAEPKRTEVAVDEIDVGGGASNRELHRLREARAELHALIHGVEGRKGCRP